MYDEAAESKFWSAFQEAEQGRSTTSRFTGQAGLARRSRVGQFTTERPGRYSTTLARVQLDHVAIEAERSTPYRYIAPRDSTRPRLITFLVLGEGHLLFSGSDDFSEFELRHGDAALIDTDRPLLCDSEQDSAVLRALVGIEHFPWYLRDQMGVAHGPLQRTALVDSYTAAISSILRSAASGLPAHGAQIVQSISALQASIVAEAVARSRPTGDAAALRLQIEEHISTHLHDPELSPSSIADELQISLRQVHLVFNTNERTIARSIRAQRSAAVAREILDHAARPRLDDLAAHHGFTTAEAMTRAFRAEFGTTPTGYWRAAQQHPHDRSQPT